MTNRREFLAGAMAATAAAGVCGAETVRPRLRIGAMTDNHLHAKRPETHRKTRACFELFRREEVDIVVDTGDIVDLSHVDQLEYFRGVFDELFAGTATVPFFCLANHDYNYLPGTRRNDPEVIGRAVAALKMDSRNPCATVKGYRFASYFQNERIEVLEENVRAAVAASEPGRPVFVVTHVPPFGTTTGTVHWSSRPIRAVLDKYPQVVNLSGHIHAAITWAANIWQGTFTAINLGAHAQYSNPIDGEATILDVYDDRIDVRRYEAVTGREIGADDRWSIPLPLDPAHGPYRPEVRAAKAVRPALPADFAVGYEQSADGLRGKLTFRSAEPPGKSWHYLVKLESQADDGSWRFLSTLNWATPQVLDEPKTWSCLLHAPLLDAGRRHRVTVTPVNSHGVEGGAKTVAFDVPASACRALPAELARIGAVRRGGRSGGAEVKPGADGWYGPTMGVYAEFPAALTDALRAAKAAVCVLDVATEQGDSPCTLTLARIPAAGGEIDYHPFGGRIYTRPGNFASHRYAFPVAPARLAAGDRVCLVVREGAPMRFRVNSARFVVS